MSITRDYDGLTVADHRFPAPVEAATMSAGATLPILSAGQLADALARYRELQTALDTAMPDQIMVLDGKPFRKKGYWRAIRLAFNLSVEPTTPMATRCVLGVLPDGTENYSYTVTYRAMAPNGATCVGDGTCTASEKTKGRMKATEHNVCSHAHTRAMNRAISNLVGFGEVSAEEVAHPDAAANTATTEPLIDGSHRHGLVRAVFVTDVTLSTGSTDGKSWRRVDITFSDGRSGSTFDEALAQDARTWRDGGVPVEALFVRKGKYTNLTGLKAAGPAESDEPEIPF